MQKLLDKLMVRIDLMWNSINELRSYKIIRRLLNLKEKKSYINRKIGRYNRLLPEMGQGIERDRKSLEWPLLVSQVRYNSMFNAVKIHRRSSASCLIFLCSNYYLCTCLSFVSPHQNVCKDSPQLYSQYTEQSLTRNKHSNIY